MTDSKQYKQVSYLWDENTAAALKDDEVGLLIYRSNLLGADLRLTNYGGGNTSCKVLRPDPLTFVYGPPACFEESIPRH